MITYFSIWVALVALLVLVAVVACNGCRLFGHVSSSVTHARTYLNLTSEPPHPRSDSAYFVMSYMKKTTKLCVAMYVACNDSIYVEVSFPVAWAGTMGGWVSLLLSTSHPLQQTTQLN